MVVVPAVPVEACLIPPEILSISSAVGAGAVVVVGTVVVAAVVFHNIYALSALVVVFLVNLSVYNYIQFVKTAYFYELLF